MTGFANEQPQLLRLHKAAAEGDLHAVLTLLANDRHLAEERGANGETALHFAAAMGHANIVGVLVEAGSDLNACDADGFTALRIATGNNHRDAVSVLVNLGANVQQKDDDGLTPLHVAAEDGSNDIVRILLSVGADPNVSSAHGETPMHYAVIGDHAAVIETLLEAGANMKATNADGWTPLDFAGGTAREVLIGRGYLKDDGANARSQSFPARAKRHEARKPGRG